MSGAWHGGKGSGRRNMSISQEEYDNRWDHIFSRDLKEDKVEMPGTVGGAKIVLPEDNTGTSKNEYYDVLTTEDALRSNDETREALQNQK